MAEGHLLSVVIRKVFVVAGRSLLYNFRQHSVCFCWVSAANGLTPDVHLGLREGSYQVLPPFLVLQTTQVIIYHGSRNRVARWMPCDEVLHVCICA